MGKTPEELERIRARAAASSEYIAALVGRIDRFRKKAGGFFARGRCESCGARARRRPFGDHVLCEKCAS